MKHNRIIAVERFGALSLVLLLGALSFSEETENSNPYYHPNPEFVSGRNVENLSDPIFYDTYVPIIYKIPMPKHTDSALRLIWGNVKSCIKSKTEKLCPIAHHLFQVVKKLGDDMGFWKPYYLNHTASKQESLKKRTGFEVVCNEIGPHFFRSYTSKAQLDNYGTALRACSRIANKVQVHVPPGNWVVDKAVYYKMLESYKKTYFDQLPPHVDWAITLNTYTSVHGLLLTNHVMESVRLASAHRICQSGLIPQTFISMEMLTEALQGASRNLARWNYQLVYTNLLQDIEEYYKLPLADCTFSDDYTFIIRILAPIKRMDITHKLIQINAIPFLEKLSNNSGIPERLCRLKFGTSKLTLIESNTGLLLDTRCEPNQLCKTSEISTVFENDACTTSLLTDNRQLITNTCKFSCFSVDSVALPLIQRISPDTYVLVGNSTTPIYINCFDKPKEMIPIRMKNVGALRVKLACNCHILYSNHVSYRPRDPCTGKTTVEHILPYHWYNEQLNTTLEKYEKDITVPGKVNGSSDSDSTTDSSPVVNNDDESNSNKTAPEFTADVQDDQIEKSVEEQEEQLEQNFLPKHKVVVRKVVPATSDGLVVQLSILWTLVIILGVSTLFLAYHVRKLSKWRQMQAYKDTRILYKIPETPDENKVINNF